jgi:hypothetical protein
LRPLLRRCAPRDDVVFGRDRAGLRDARAIRFRDLAVGDRRDPVLFAVLPGDRPLALCDLGKDFFTGRRLRACFETADGTLQSISCRIEGSLR